MLYPNFKNIKLRVANKQVYTEMTIKMVFHVLVQISSNPWYNKLEEYFSILDENKLANIESPNGKGGFLND